MCHTFGHGWVVCPGHSVFAPIDLPAVTALVALTVSSGFILAPPPYRMVNAGSCDYKKKKFFSWKQNNCFELLSITQFAYNSAKSKTPTISPLEANYVMLP